MWHRAAVSVLPLVALALGIPGCTGPAGPAGPPGAAASAPSDDDAGTSETDAGFAEAAAPDAGSLGTSLLSERAREGLALSPVPLDLASVSPATAEVIGRGSYLVNAVGSCSDCHTPSGPPPLRYLAGGTPFAADHGAVVYARNLTPEPKTGLQLSEAEFIAALRTGKDFRNAKSVLLVMPWPHLRWLTTADLKAIYGYLRALPPVVNAIAADSKSASVRNGPPGPAPRQYDEGDVLRPLPPEIDAEGAAVRDDDGVLQGLALRPLAAPTDAALAALPPAEQEQVGRGAYLVNAAQCSDCHTNPPRLEVTPGAAGYLKVNTAEYLTGGRVYPVPPPLAPTLQQARTMTSNLLGASNGFFNEDVDSFVRFVALLRTGTHADEATEGGSARALGWPMPWADFKNLDDADLQAIYRYLKLLPPATGAADKVTADYAVSCTANRDCAPGLTCDAAAQECVGAACTAASAASDCPACQPCSAGKCTAPLAGAACVDHGI